MAHLLFDTGAMRTMAGDMGATAGDLLERVGAITLDASVVMPPSMAIEAAEVLAGVSRDLVESSGFYAANAADVATRAAIVEAENAGGGVIISLRAMSRRLFSSGSRLEQEIAGRFPGWARGAQRPFDEAFNIGDRLSTVWGYIGAANDGVKAFVSHDLGRQLSKIVEDDSRIERDLKVTTFMGKVAVSPVGKVLKKFNVVATAYGFVSNTRSEWNATQGESLPDRIVAAGVGDVFYGAVNFTPFGYVDMATGGGLTSTLDAGGQWVGQGASDAVTGWKRNGLAGAVTGFGHGVVQAGSSWRDQAEEGKAGRFAHGLIRTEDWFIEKL